MEIRFEDVTMIYPFQKVTGIFGRKEKEKIRKAQEAMPFTSNEGVIALQHINLAIRDKAFTVIVGPSGSGKSTLLRLIAGLERPTLGTITFDGQDVSMIKAEDRDIAMVFQNYSLYPNQTVYQNIAFPLEVRHMPREQVEEEVKKIAALLNLDKKLDRLPQDLSGGEKQRVAIARSLVRHPKALLLDEPFSNLDAPMRRKLRNELKKVHRAYETTFVYVTHDQYDALSLSEDLIVLKDGLLKMNGPASRVYNEPSDIFCASFLGSPEMNFFRDVPVSSEGVVSFYGEHVSLKPSQKKALKKKNRVTLGIRPANIMITEEGEEASVEYVELIETDLIIHCEYKGQKLTILEKAKSNLFIPYERGQKIRIRMDKERFHLFDEEGNRI
ncbi:MAG: ABC transporter ATP-binding protein [Erysipelotrichaceae bacterium]|nr:ABC transporter ATP-binding protein [Erysipelotrichaceae bacterium]